MDYVIGQVMKFTRDYEVEKALSGTKVIVPKGTKVIIGADGLAHYEDGAIQPLGDDAVVKGYDAGGIADWITAWLRRQLPLYAVFIATVDENEFTKEIEAALEDIGIG